MSRFKDQNLVITGAAAGLGASIAGTFAVDGCNVFILDKTYPREVVGQLKDKGVRADAIQCDVRDEEQVVAGVRKAAEFYDGKIDILVNNAGFNGYYQLCREADIEKWKDTFAINLFGTILVTREAIPYLEKSEAGRICNLASNVGKRGLPYRGDYVCTKWGMIGYTQTLALELADKGIRVNAVCPGPIEGERIEDVMNQHARVEGLEGAEVRKIWEEAAPLKRFAKPDEVAKVIKFLCSEDSSAMTGQALNVTCGFIMN